MVSIIPPDKRVELVFHGFDLGAVVVEFCDGAWRRKNLAVFPRVVL